MPKKRTPAPRVRRTAEDAREAILDAAERRLVASGPAGIRLQEVAADVGMAHSTVLHHFESREGLVEAVCTRAAQRLSADVIAAIREAEGDRSIAPMLERVSAMLGPGGHARVVAWLALSGIETSGQKPDIATVAEAAHALRRARRTGKKKPVPPLEDTYFTLLLATLALFGDAVAGPMIRGEDRESADRTSARFRVWLAKLLVEHLDEG